jgi:Tol biopolymer transport system component
MQIDAVGWSRDGSHFAFVWSGWSLPIRMPDPQVAWARLYTARSDGSELTVMGGSNHAGPIEFTWSPDGTQLASVGDDASIYLSDLDPETSGGRVGTLVYQQLHDPAWSPDGNKLAYAGRRESDTYHAIYVVDLKSNQESRLTSGNIPALQPTWSPDGQQLAFVKGDYRWEGFSSPTGDIYVMHADGSSLVRLTDGEHPAWSPDGRRIAFTRAVEFPAYEVGLYLMNADGSSQAKLVSQVSGFEAPTWSPDGKRIAITAIERGIVVVDVSSDLAREKQPHLTLPQGSTAVNLNSLVR